jgi:hypothetical protein
LFVDENRSLVFTQMEKYKQRVYCCWSWT